MGRIGRYEHFIKQTLTVVKSTHLKCHYISTSQLGCKQASYPQKFSQAASTQGRLGDTVSETTNEQVTTKLFTQTSGKGRQTHSRWKQTNPDMGTYAERTAAPLSKRPASLQAADDIKFDTMKVSKKHCQ